MAIRTHIAASGMSAGSAVACSARIECRISADSDHMMFESGSDVSAYNELLEAERNGGAFGDGLSSSEQQKKAELEATSARLRHAAGLDSESALKVTSGNPLAEMKVRKEDKRFRNRNGEYIHDVRRVKLEDGTVGYFKPVQEDAGHWAFARYGQSAETVAKNEVAAYHLAQALGEGYEDMVPETVIREYDGKIGTFQKEAKGKTLARLVQDFGKPKVALKEGRWAKGYIFDRIAGTQLRHMGDIVINANGMSKKPADMTLIDNGFSFPESEKVDAEQTHIRYRIADEDKRLTPNDRSRLKNLLEDPSFGGVRGHVSPLAFQRLRERVQALLDE